ncbi:hypothetical protein SDC9_94135 [bioreactor metagenome]|uniref:Uncharacterized protein n=1 Tax=bioreactor metagenome TaxID=1076179 RepID=A0A645A2L3_9ZZZZ
MSGRAVIHNRARDRVGVTGPLGVERRVRGDGVGSEIPSGCACEILIPADEGIAFTGGRCRWCQSRTVYDTAFGGVGAAALEVVGVSHRIRADNGGPKGCQRYIVCDDNVRTWCVAGHPVRPAGKGVFGFGKGAHIALHCDEGARFIGGGVCRNTS